jgi:membrane peptidoglycan carboxypeptidase
MTVRHPAPARERGRGPGVDPYRLSLAPYELFRARRQRGRRHRITRRLRRTVAVASAVAALGTIGFGALTLITPAVGNAWQLVRAQDRAHHAAYPGPPVPRRFAASLAAADDHGFGAEPGIGPAAIARVSLAGLAGGGQSGATLYQQLARLLYTPGDSGLAARAEQVVLGVKLEQSYTAAQILQMYADVAYFGHGFYGLAAASCGYFAEPPARLSWPQAAMLAALVQAPAGGDPFHHPANARAREAHVLGRLVAAHALTSAQATAALRRQPRLAARPASACRSSR